MDDLRSTNIIGAMALAVAERIRRDVSGPLGMSDTAAAGIALIGFAPGSSIDAIRRSLLLTHSAVVRLVDRLVAAGTVERMTAPNDGRVVALRLTASGQALWRALLSERQVGLEFTLSVLSSEELHQFARLAGKVLGGSVRDADHARHLCRLCNYQICSDCPVEAGLGSTESRTIDSQAREVSHDD